MIIAELIEKLQTLDPKADVLAFYYTADDFELDGETCTALAFQSAVENTKYSGDVILDTIADVLGEAVYSAMGWNEPTGHNDPCLHGCVCGGN